VLLELRVGIGVEFVEPVSDEVFLLDFAVVVVVDLLHQGNDFIVGDVRLGELHHVVDFSSVQSTSAVVIELVEDGGQERLALNELERKKRKGRRIRLLAPRKQDNQKAKENRP
jgi:hypothetical protein